MTTQFIKRELIENVKVFNPTKLERNVSLPPENNNVFEDGWVKVHSDTIGKFENNKFISDHYSFTDNTFVKFGVLQFSLTKSYSEYVLPNFDGSDEHNTIINKVIGEFLVDEFVNVFELLKVIYKSIEN